MITAIIAFRRTVLLGVCVLGGGGGGWGGGILKRSVVQIPGGFPGLFLC